jgi:hypothetical protein
LGRGNPSYYKLGFDMQNNGSGFIAIINYSSTQVGTPQPAPEPILTESGIPILTENLDEITTE